MNKNLIYLGVCHGGMYMGKALRLRLTNNLSIFFMWDIFGSDSYVPTINPGELFFGKLAITWQKRYMEV